MKRKISLFLALLMIIQMFPVVASATTEAPFSLIATVEGTTATVQLKTTEQVAMGNFSFILTIPEGCSITKIKKGKDYNTVYGQSYDEDGELISGSFEKNEATGVASCLPVKKDGDTIVPAESEMLVYTLDISGANSNNLTFTGTFDAAYSITNKTPLSWEGATVTSNTLNLGGEGGASTTSDYEIYYTLDSTTDNVTPNYKDYEISPDANTETEVIATIKLKNNTNTAVTLQAYDIYLSYGIKNGETVTPFSGLKYSSETMGGAPYIDGADITATAQAGQNVTHIEAIGDTFTAVNLAAKSEITLGTVTFTIDKTAVQYGMPLAITLIQGSEDQGEETTNISLANTETVNTQGDKKSYYPTVTQTVDGVTYSGAEVVTTYAVTYNANGGNGGITSATKQYNIPLALEFINIPSREGYTFLGWDESSTATTATYTSTGTSSYTDNEGTKLYAVWKQNNVTVIFNMNGHGENTTESVVPGNTVTKPTDPTATGYTFGGWYTDASCTAGNEFSFDTPVTEAKILYAKWTATPYTISYVLDGGENAVSNPAVYTIESDTITLANPTKEGYTFDAWYTDEACTVKGNTIATGSTENKIFYAKWNINKYEVSFAKGDHGTLTGNLNQTVEHGSVPVYPTVTPDAGYTFDAWYDGEGNKINTDTYTVTGAVALTAKYTPNSYTVKFDNNGGDGTNIEDIPATYGENVKMPSGEGLSKDGYVFAGWAKSATATAAEYTAGTAYSNLTTEKEITLYAVWLKDVYQIEYSHDPAGVNFNKTMPTTYSSKAGLTINAPTADGYTFKGWTSTALSISEENMSQSATINAGQTGTVDLKAHWDIINYNITYNLDSGTNAASNPATYNITSETITLADPTKAGYKFEGWYDKAEDGKKVETIETGSVGDVTLYAKWSVIEYDIIYDLDSGTNADRNPDKYTVETETITLADPSKTGYTFAGWYDQDEGGNKVETIEKGSVGNVTFYAKWTENQYTIKYDTDGLETAIPDVIVGYDDEVTLPTATKPGYTLTGWSETANTDVGADPQYPINEKESKLKTGVDGEKEITLYPVWKYAEYTLSFELGAHPATDAQKPTAVPVTYNGTYANLPTVTPATGYNFEGWFVDVNDPNTKIKNGDVVMITESTTVTAKYSAIQYIITYNPDNGSTAWAETYTVEDAVTIATAPEKGLYKFAGWTVSGADGSWADKSLVDEGSTYAKGACYGSVTLNAKWDIPFTYKVEEYKYAYTDYVMLRIATESDANCYSFGGVNMFYTDDQYYQLDVKVGEDESATTEKRNVFVTLIPEKDGETPLVDDDMKLTEAGMKKLAETTVTAAKIDRNGDVNGDTVLNIADANVVYQMVVNGGGYYSNGDVANGQLDTYHRLVADMNTAYTEGDYRGTTTDVDWIVKLINGVDPTATTN